jgi:hypothetical protein
VARALREAPAGHQYDRVLNAKMTLAGVLVACLFPGGSYDKVPALASGLPGLRVRPPWEKVPAGSAFSRARKLLGGQVLRRVFGIGAETSGAGLGVTAHVRTVSRRWIAAAAGRVRTSPPARSAARSGKGS